MTEILNNTQIKELSLENSQLEEPLELLSNNEQNNETIEFLTKCNMSIFNFTKDKTNDVILKPKEKIIKKKYKLFQYNLTLKNYVRINNFATFSEISKYLENLDIKINLKTLLKNKLLKIELII
jgi:hypothetical protein